MSDAALRNRAAAPLPEFREPVPDALVLMAPSEANDNNLPAARQQPEPRMFELPATIWGSMIACYSIFLLALLGATGGSRATFAIVISAVYLAMFFGTARAMVRQTPSQLQRGLDRRNAVLQTACGPLAQSEVYGQVLIVPVAVAFFGLAISLISAMVM